MFLPRRYLRSLFGNFTKLKNCLFLVWKNYFFPIETIVVLEKNFKISYSNIYLSFGNFGERERLSVCEELARRLEIETIIISTKKRFRRKILTMKVGK